MPYAEKQAEAAIGLHEELDMPRSQQMVFACGL